MDDADVIQLIVRAVMCLLGIMGNHVLAFRSLPRTLSRLKTPEALFLNLAASNLITNYLVDLPETLADIAGDWFLGDTYCGISNFCSDLSETSSILATVFISIFWYQKLVGALKRGNAPVKLESLCLACVLVVASWCIAIVFSVPHLFYFAMGKENSNETGRDCKDRFPSSSSKLTYEVMYLTAANAVPIALMVFVNLQIVVTLLTQRNRIEEARGNPARPTKTSQNPGPQVRAAKSVVAVATVFLICWVTHLSMRIANFVNESPLNVKIISYVGASYTCVIPYIFLYGVKKLSCQCRK
ncbi:NPY1R protein, partial [Amia calva]|nr:NPY1R protein [Amia calva]